MKRISLHIIYFLWSLLWANQSFAQDSIHVVTTWLKQNSILIKYLTAGNNYSDLRPLKNILKDVKVIGLGETTHGTREFFQMKHRLVEFLVTEMDFTTLILESSYTATQPINDYILTGKGSRATVLTGQGYTVYDTEEFSAMLDWMRAYNQKIPDAKKIRIYGMDLCCNTLGRKNISAFLQKYAPEKISGTDSLFKKLASEEEKWPSRLNENNLKQSFFPLHELINFFKTNKSRLVSASSLGEWEKAYKHSQVMEQWIVANIEDTSFLPQSQMPTRSEYMGQNVLYLIDKEKLDTKFMVWAHNGHIAHPASKNVGSRLKERFGDKYFALGFEFNQGTFQSRIKLPDSTWGNLASDTILPVEKNLSWYLSRAGTGNSIIDLRSSSSNPVVEKWLATQRRINVGHWMYRGSAKNFSNRALKNYWDGIFFIELSTPSHPTKNAITRSANRIGF